MAFPFPLMPVQSTVIKALAYDPTRALLVVQFSDDDVYHHPNVPEATYRDLMQASSMGAYYNTQVRRAFPGHLVTEEEG